MITTCKKFLIIRMTIIGYKATDTNLRCKDHHFMVGREEWYDGELELCRSGFHFCRNVGDLKKYYPNGRYFKCEVLGDVIDSSDKSVTNRIRLVEEIGASDDGGHCIIT